MRQQHLVYGFVIVMALVVLACGGGGDETATRAQGGASATATPAGAMVATNATGQSPTPSGGSSAPAGAPTPTNPDFPDVFADFAPGSSAEADTGADPATQQPGRARVTVDAISDDAEPVSSFFERSAGHRLLVIDVTIESVGQGSLATPEFWLVTTDGVEHAWIGGTGHDYPFLYFELPPGESRSGSVVFELPEGSEVAWFVVDPNMYVGRNVIFLSE
jgi:hypothetical protein